MEDVKRVYRELMKLCIEVSTILFIITILSVFFSTFLPLEYALGLWILAIASAVNSAEYVSKFSLLKKIELVEVSEVMEGSLRIRIAFKGSFKNVVVKEGVLVLMQSFPIYDKRLTRKLASWIPSYRFITRSKPRVLILEHKERTIIEFFIHYPVPCGGVFDKRAQGTIFIQGVLLEFSTLSRIIIGIVHPFSKPHVIPVRNHLVIEYSNVNAKLKLTGGRFLKGVLDVKMLLKGSIIVEVIATTTLNFKVSRSIILLNTSKTGVYNITWKPHSTKLLKLILLPLPTLANALPFLGEEGILGDYTIVTKSEPYFSHTYTLRISFKSGLQSRVAETTINVSRLEIP